MWESSKYLKWKSKSMMKFIFNSKKKTETLIKNKKQIKSHSLTSHTYNTHTQTLHSEVEQKRKKWKRKTKRISKKKSKS